MTAPPPRPKSRRLLDGLGVNRSRCGRLAAVVWRGATRVVWLVFLWCAGVKAEINRAALPPAVDRPIHFQRDVQPLLQRYCVDCHGPTKSKGGLRLDSREAAFRGGESYAEPIRPRDSEASPLIHLVAGLVPEMRMPAKGEPLSIEAIGVLRGWIDQGAVWPEAAGTSGADSAEAHWAFRPVQRPAVPNAGERERWRHPIDAWIDAKLKEAGIDPSPEADRVTLLRRLFLVTLGLPPSPEEVAAFVVDEDPGALERWVDRLLDDARYGERWGRHWLDVIRFAESNGFETNRERLNAWRFRDYVIGAFNSDKPYDQFVREQIAGDALGVDVATGFLVGGPVDIVGSPDVTLTLQQRADELDDMVGTTGTAFLGLTLGCARCHTHKFDPISHREYYAMTAIFAGVRHGERSLPLPDDRRAAWAEADRRVRALEGKLARFLPAVAGAGGLAAAQAQGEARRPAVSAARNEEVFVATPARFLRFTIRATTGGEPCLDELEVWSGGTNIALATLGVRASASGTLPGFSIHQLEHIHDGRVGNSYSWISDEPGKGWVQLEWALPVMIERVVWGRDREGQFHDRLATQYQVEVAVQPGDWRTVASSDTRAPFQGQVEKTRGPEYDFAGRTPAEVEEGQRWLREMEALRRERDALAKGTMVYAGSFSQPGPTYRLHRGDILQKREVVAPGTLALFRPVTLATNTPEQARRLALADWMVHPANPLIARVMVNRIWQYQFGVGLVSTPNDFGRNGARPSHPELLDWLASEFMHPQLPAKPWSIKHLQRLILTSATWRRSGVGRPDALSVDATSRLWWRFPPRRLEAEGIRDSILAVSGNLDRRAGGASYYLHEVDRENVVHYHPKERFGPAEWRRMIYAFKVRMEQDGIFGSFDCPDGSLVMPRRSVSTTPLQALNLFNSRFVLDQSERMSERLRAEVGAASWAQITRAWQLAFARAPLPGEMEAAMDLVADAGLPALCRAILNANEFLFIP